MFPNDQSFVYDWCFDQEQRSWVKWMDTVYIIIMFSLIYLHFVYLWTDCHADGSHIRPISLVSSRGLDHYKQGPPGASQVSRVRGAVQE